MAAKFDTAIPELVEICEGTAGFGDVAKACLVRDLRGRVRLVLEAPEGFDLAALGGALHQRLGAWFCGPVLSSKAGVPSERHLARTMLERAVAWPGSWPRTRVDALGAAVPIGDRWCGYQRLLSKQAWLDSPARGGRWPLDREHPAIVAFYSFKGGVGRSTLLGVMAWQLAHSGRRVVCIDLDLEAPGLAGLLQANAEESVIDHLLSHAATGQLPGDDPVSWVTLHGAEIGVVVAGRMDRSYIEKLGRLDYLGTAAADDSPVARALGVLLERIRGQHRPDMILLDCRAGLHDLGGLSLTDVAQVDVLVGRDTPQGREGLALTLEVLGARRPEATQRVLVAQTMVPLPLEGEVARATQARFRSAMYEACSRTLYATLDEMPAEDDEQVAHFPWPVGLYDEVAACEHLGEVSPGTLENAAYAAIRRRIEALAAPEAEPAELEDDDGDAE